mgnify:CR=1 FL=1
MKLDIKKFSLAAAVTMGAIYIICLVFVLLFPSVALQLLGWLVHLVNVDKFAGDVQITFLGFVLGLVQVLVYTYLAALLGAWLHNKFMKR